MRMYVVTGIAAAALFAASALESAVASGLPTKAPPHKAPSAAPPYNWAGPYVGATFGGAWTSGNLNIPDNNFYGGITELIGGAEVGYNLQAGHFLLGLEGDFDWASFDHPPIDHPPMAAPTLGVASQHWIGTVAGRFGVVDDRWLLFAKVGGGWVGSGAVVNAPGPPWSGAITDPGWLLGGGIEYGLKPHMTVKLEYDYLAQSNWSSGTIPAVGLDRDVQMVKAGINYKFVSGAAAAPEPAPAAAEPSEDLQKQSENPIADLISVPFQSNTNFNAAPFDRTQEILNIQPVVPLHLTNDWNVISRTIVPVMSQPDPVFDSSTNGIGDITQSLFLSPARPGALIWGIGPVFTVPSASDPILGAGRVQFGPTAVLLTTPGHWVIGALVNNQWSVGGNPLRPAVNNFLAQPFINYNMPHGWFLTTSPIITSNWLAAPGQQWTVPIGGGFGRVFNVGTQPLSASIAGYYNAIRPTGTPDWQLRATLAFLFPSN